MQRVATNPTAQCPVDYEPRSNSVLGSSLTPDGLPVGATIQAIRLADIRLDDRRFQYRLDAAVGGLEESLALSGQQMPVVLWGAKSPHVVVDGFRRIEAARRNGWASIRAIIRDDIDEDEAYAVSFLENVRRKNFSPMDKANAIWKGVHERRLSKDELALDFNLSTRQVDRYLRLLDLEECVKKSVIGGKISMAHAVVIHRAGRGDARDLIESIARDAISAEELKRRLGKHSRRGRPKRYIVTDDHGFRISCRYRSNMAPREKGRIRDALERALQIVAS